MLDAVARTRAALLAQGFVPVAVQTGGKASKNVGWNDRVDGDASLPTVPSLLNTGVRCNGLRAVDVDVDDSERASKVRQLALDRLGPAPMRWRENSSRITLLYRAAIGEPDKRSIVSKTFKNIDDKFEKVEVLGAGQQFVAYGTHPSGVELRWEPEGPLEVSRDALTAVTEAQIDGFLAEAAKIIDAPMPSNGAVAPPSAVQQKPPPAPVIAPPRTLTPEQLTHMENTAKRSLRRIIDAPSGTSNDAINREARTLAGLVAAGLHDGEALRSFALNLALERAAKGGNTPEETQRTFKSGWASGTLSPWVPDATDAARRTYQPRIEAILASWQEKRAQPRLNGVQTSLAPQSKIVLSFAEFMAEYRPLEYVLEGIIVRGSLYTLTSGTGAGKTTWLSAENIALASGDAAQIGVGVKKGAVAYLTFENPDDFRMKLCAAAVANGKSVDDLTNLWVIRANIKPEASFAELNKMGVEFIQVTVDTLQAAFDGTDFNNNKEMLEFIRRCRAFTGLPGNPAVVVAAHPVKNAQSDNLVPYGGGSVLNELDGNLTLSLVRETMITTLHWQGKFRGPEFTPLSYHIKGTKCSGLLDVNGKALSPPTVSPVNSDYIAKETDATEKREMSLLQMLKNNQNATLAEMAEHSGYGSHSAAQKAFDRMLVGKLVDKIGRKYAITKKGEKMLALYYGGGGLGLA
jgi:hypothetical protein